MDLTEILIGFISGVASSVIPKFFRSKKEGDDFLLELIKTLREEIARLREDVKIARSEAQEAQTLAQQKYEALEREYNELLKKHNQLKTDFTNYKKQKGNDIPTSN